MRPNNVVINISPYHYGHNVKSFKNQILYLTRAIKGTERKNLKTDSLIKNEFQTDVIEECKIRFFIEFQR